MRCSPRRAAINWDAVIDRGTQTLREFRREPSELPLKAFEARWVTWRQAQAAISKAEAVGADGVLFRTGAILLAELALLEVCRHAPWNDRLARGLELLNQQHQKDEDKKRKHEDDFLSPLGEYALLHSNLGHQVRPLTGDGKRRPSDPKALDVFSQLARHLVTIRPRVKHPYAVLFHLKKAVHPPLVEIASANAQRLQQTVLAHRKRHGTRAPSLIHLARRFQSY